MPSLAPINCSLPPLFLPRCFSPLNITALIAKKLLASRPHMLHYTSPLYFMPCCTYSLHFAGCRTSLLHFLQCHTSPLRLGRVLLRRFIVWHAIYHRCTSCRTALTAVILGRILNSQERAHASLRQFSSRDIFSSAKHTVIQSGEAMFIRSDSKLYVKRTCFALHSRRLTMQFIKFNTLF